MPELTEQDKSNVRALWEALPAYSGYISAKLEIRISPIDVLLALTEATGKELQDLANITWSKESVKETIQSTSIVKNLPVIIEQVDLDDSIIPNNVIRDINEEQIKFKGERWIVHKNDVDPFPSNPHAHNYEAGLKLHLGNGELYNGTQLAGKITKKNFKKLRGLFKHVKLPKDET